MKLAFDERVTGEPGFHALVVGVSHYPHMPKQYGMRQLTAPAMTAYRIYKWLLDRRANLRVPLASVRLLLSPSPDEAEVIAGDAELGGRWGEASTDEFVSAAEAWRDDAARDARGMTLFYFAGHGIQLSKNDQFLLMKDFGRFKNEYAGSVSAVNIYDGMSNGPNEQLADTQFYFFDACRNLPRQRATQPSQGWSPQLVEYDDLDARKVFKPSWSVADRRKAPAFYAAVPGTAAYAEVGGLTLFGKALLDSLDCSSERWERVNGKRRWQVTARTLSDTVSAYFKEVAKEVDVEQQFTEHRVSKDAILHYLDERPWVEVAFELEPAAAQRIARVVVQDYNDVTHLSLPVPVEPHPFTDKLPWGDYNVTASFQPPAPPLKDCERRLDARLPRQTVKLECQ
jgi:hypothetical protein